MTNEKLNRTLSGRVTSNKMDKTVTVIVERRLKHPLYGKFVTRTKKYHAHDDNNQFSIGDFVEIVECRPLSRTKNWKVTRILNEESNV